MTDVQVAIRLWRETGTDFFRAVFPIGQVFSDNVADEISWRFYADIVFGFVFCHGMCPLQ